MTPAELHSRILLHELRTILLDETREGQQIPQDWKEIIQASPHDPSPYLVLSEELEEQADPLGELIRIQVELIGLLPMDGMFYFYREFYQDTHPFYRDVFALAGVSNSHTNQLTKRRWAITCALYDEPYRDEWRQMRSSHLGRTTRMLTDILRYCAMNQGKHVLGIFQSGIATHHQLLSHIWVELTGEEPLKRDYVGNPSWPMHIWGNRVHFGQPGMTQLLITHRIPRQNLFHLDNEAIAPYVQAELLAHGFDSNHPIQTEHSLMDDAWLSAQTRTPDITFTDHACHTVVPRIIRNESGGPPIPFITQATEDAAREIERNHRIRAIMAQDGRIQYNPKVAIRPESVIPDEPTETHLP